MGNRNHLGWELGIIWERNHPGLDLGFIQGGIWDRDHLGWVLWDHLIWELGQGSPGMGPGGSSRVRDNLGWVLWGHPGWDLGQGSHGNIQGGIWSRDHLGWDLGWEHVEWQARDPWDGP